MRNALEVFGVDRALVTKVHAPVLLGHHLAVVAAAEHGDLVAALDEPRAELFDVPLDAAPRGGHAALADHRDSQGAHAAHAQAAPACA